MYKDLLITKTFEIVYFYRMRQVISLNVLHLARRKFTIDDYISKTVEFFSASNFMLLIVLLLIIVVESFMCIGKNIQNFLCVP